MIHEQHGISKETRRPKQRGTMPRGSLLADMVLTLTITGTYYGGHQSRISATMPSTRQQICVSLWHRELLPWMTIVRRRSCKYL